MPEPLLMFQCCEHCESDKAAGEHDLPHKTMCDHGCNDDEAIDSWDEGHA